MDEDAHEERRARWERLRWRLRGAVLWPTYAVVTVLDATLLHLLPIAGEGIGWIPAFLLAGSLNLIAVAVLGQIGGWWLRRRRTDLPKVVADDYAGTALVVAMALVFLVAGLVHRPALIDAERDFQAQSNAVRQFVRVQGEAVYRRHIDRANTLRLQQDLYRTCVPGERPNRALCLLVDTSASPPGLRRDTNEDNETLNRPGGF